MGVVPDQPGEHLPAAAELVGPAGRVLQDLAFERGVGRLGQGGVVRALADSGLSTSHKKLD